MLKRGSPRRSLPPLSPVAPLPYSVRGRHIIREMDTLAPIEQVVATG